MNTIPETTESKQDRSVQIINFSALALVPVVVLTALMAGNNPVVHGVAAAVFAGLGFASGSMPGTWARIGAGQALVGQAIVLTAALAGHRWQIDSHMFFFAVLACMMVLGDWRVVVAAAATIVVHHLSLSVLVPSMIYPSDSLAENIPRTLLHGLVVAIETSALVLAIRTRNRLDQQAALARENLAAKVEEAERARVLAEETSREAEIAKGAAEDSSRAANEALTRADEEAERARIADENLRATEAAEREDRERRAEQQQQVFRSLSGALGAMSNGNLNTKIQEAFPEEYEALRQDFNHAVDRIADLVSALVESSGAIRSESANLNSAATEMSRRTESQAASLEETAAAITELASSVENSSSGARDAAQTVVHARDRSDAGAKVVQSTIDAMTEIAESSKKISQITNVIDDIAFQTNLLALNAGVEAARAGEAGRGFSVVASEVRALAQRSSESAKEISELLSASTRQVENGVQLAHDSGEVLTEIGGMVQKLDGLVVSIADTSAQQTSTLSEISTAVNRLDQVTQQNAAMFEETTAAVSSLTAQAEVLDENTGKFTVAHGEIRREPVRKAPRPKPTLSVAEQPISSGTSAALEISEDWTEF